MKTRALVLSTFLALAGCDSGENGAPAAAAEFALADENPTSASHGELVSPRDYIGNVSAWYFGAAT